MNPHKGDRGRFSVLFSPNNASHNISYNSALAWKRKDPEPLTARDLF